MSLKAYYRREPTNTANTELRLRLLIIMVVFFALILVMRLAYLQLAQYKRYATLSLKNQMGIMPIAPTRGVITDRNGVTLAENNPVYALEIIPERVKNMGQTLDELQKLLPAITNEDIESFKATRKNYRNYDSIPLKLKLSQEDVAIFASNQYRFPGANIKARLIRHYPLGEKTAHVLGYVGRLNLHDLQQVDSANYRATNAIGKSGIEKFYEDTLHGQVGYQQIETDVSGRTLRTISKQTPIPGKKLVLTLDAELQQKVHNILQGKQGAVVVLNPNNGEILAMVSAPSFNPNLFTSGISSKAYNKLAQSIDNPLFNRAIRGLYPPASTIKPILGLAGLDKNLITAKQHVFDPGWFKIDGATHIYHDWKRVGHGMVNLKRAIVVSCDTYFYQLGNKMGITAIEDILNQFGFGQFSKIDLPEEARGLVPSPTWKRANQKASWYTGDTIITTIGQGSMMTTMIQLANATSTIATHGHRFRPHLLKQEEGANGNINSFTPFEEYPVTVNNDHDWNTIIDAMQEVVTSREGTGHRFGKDNPYTVAAKTGTAQVYNESSYAKKTYKETPVFLRDHSLFVGFAPVKKPEIAIAVIIEHDYMASRISRQVMDAYFKTEKQDEK